MRLTGAMRVWAFGQIILVADVAAGPAMALVGAPLSARALAGPAPILGAALAFFLIPTLLLVGFSALRTRWWVWIGASLPALLWVPSMPFALLLFGPQLDSVAGLALVAAGLISAVVVAVSGLLAALDTRRRDGG